MSRAFVKETDDVPALPDRPVSEHPNLVTRQGLVAIEAEVTRHGSELAAAQTAGDAAAIAAASRELRYWTQRRASAELQPPPQDCDVVRFGCRVTIARDEPGAGGTREQTFVIVGEDEADPSNGKLSYVSPMAQALMGRGEGEEVRVAGRDVEIVRIEAGV